MYAAFFTGDVADRQGNRGPGHVRDDIDVLLVDPVPRDDAADIRLVLMIGRQNLDVDALRGSAEILDRHLRGHDRAYARQIGIDPRLIVQDADLDVHIFRQARAGPNTRLAANTCFPNCPSNRHPPRRNCLHLAPSGPSPSQEWSMRGISINHLLYIAPTLRRSSGYWRPSSFLPRTGQPPSRHQEYAAILPLWRRRRASCQLLPSLGQHRSGRPTATTLSLHATRARQCSPRPPPASTRRSRPVPAPCLRAHGGTPCRRRWWRARSGPRHETRQQLLRPLA